VIKEVLSAKDYRIIVGMLRAVFNCTIRSIFRGSVINNTIVWGFTLRGNWSLILQALYRGDRDGRLSNPSNTCDPQTPFDIILDRSQPTVNPLQNFVSRCWMTFLLSLILILALLCDAIVELASDLL
jgi:hypothetical protein